MSAIKALILSILLVFPGMVTANQLPDDRPWLKEQTCQYLKEGNWTVRLCKWGHKTAFANEMDMREVIAILQNEFGNDTVLYTTVMIEPPNAVLSTQYSGVYLPATGNIIVEYPYDDDVSKMMYTIAHEMLHALWDVQGVGVGEHHVRIYCNDALLKVGEFLETWVDPKQVPHIAERMWQHPFTVLKHCGPEI